MLSFRIWKLGVKSLFLHPLRSLLTVLGIFIGVASVIWLLAIGEGISREARRQIEDLGADTIIVRSMKPPSEQLADGRGPTPYGLTRANYAMLIETVPTIQSALPIREMRRQFRHPSRDRVIDGRLVGCTPEYQEVTRLVVDRGRFIEDADLLQRNNVCVLAARVAERMFPFENPIGQTIYLAEHGDYYQVVGVLQHRNPTAAIGGSLDSQDFSSDVYIPIDTMRQRIGDMVVTRGSGSMEGEVIQLNQITIRVDHVDNVFSTADLVEDSLLSNRRMDDLAIVVPRELLEQAKTMQMMFMLFMGLIAAISLLVGGIGIMNIMLATVTERTREIGIRRALGARRRDIVRQFLAETVVLSVVGGATGVLGGIFCRPFIIMLRNGMNRYAEETMSRLPEVVQHVEPSVVPWSVPLAFGIAVLVGVIFGIYPAIRAAQMDPIEALRHE